MANESDNGFFVQTQAQTYGKNVPNFSIVSNSELEKQIKAGEEKHWELYPHKDNKFGLLAFAAIALGGVGLSMLGATGASAGASAAASSAANTAATTAATASGAATASSISSLIPTAGAAVKSAAGLASAIGTVSAAAKGEPPKDWVAATDILANSDNVTNAATDIAKYLAAKNGIKVKDAQTELALREYIKRQQKQLGDKARAKQAQAQAQQNKAWRKVLPFAIPAGIFVLSKMG